MKKLKRFISQLFGLLYIWIKSLKVKHGSVANGNILIIQWGNIGDALLDVNATLALADHYEAMGKDVTIAANLRAKETLTDILNECGRSYYVIDSRELELTAIRKTLHELGQDGYETIISLFTYCNWPSLYIPICLPCNESWGVFQKRKQNLIVAGVRSFFEKRFTNRVYVPLDMHQCQRHKQLLREMGIVDYKTQIRRIPDKTPYKPIDKDYIVLSVDSSSEIRRWPDEKFIALADRLLEGFEDDICITGSKADQNSVGKYMTHFAGNSRVKILIGGLKINKWVEMIRGSRFVVSLDSGSAHVAASVGVLCICLTGVWDGTRIMPYAMDVKTEGTTEPICVLRKDVDPAKLPCYGCFSERHFGWKNKECKGLCDAGKPCLCLGKITVDDVMDAIEKARADGLIN